MSDRKLRIPVPDSLESTIRQIADSQRRSAKEVAQVVLAGVFDDLSGQALRRRWLDHVSEQLGDVEDST